MAKKDISKILSSGSVKKKLLLVEENTARETYGKESILSEKEVDAIFDSLQGSSKAEALYRKNHESRISVFSGLQNLQGLKFQTLMHYSNLRGYILVWSTLEATELMVNSVLYEVSKTKRKKLIKAFDSFLLFSDEKADPEGYLNIQVEEFLKIIGNVREEVVTSMIKYKSWEKALIDYMKDREYNVKTYKDFIKTLSKEIYEPVIEWGKYSGKLEYDLYQPRVEKLLQGYNICPNIEALEIDEEEYNSFRKEILGDD